MSHTIVQRRESVPQTQRERDLIQPSRLYPVLQLRLHCFYHSRREENRKRDPADSLIRKVLFGPMEPPDNFEKGRIPPPGFPPVSIHYLPYLFTQHDRTNRILSMELVPHTVFFPRWYLLGKCRKQTLECLELRKKFERVPINFPFLLENKEIARNANEH